MNGHLGRRLALAVLRAYQGMISPWLGPACRFTPTCSEYACDAIGRYGVLRGMGKACMRLFRCHPLSRGGWDPA